MVDWKQSLPQIIAAIIGSSLIVSALSTINSLVFIPVVDISVNKTGISLKNIGYTPATHVRMTIYYPAAKFFPYKIVYKNENMTVRNENSSSVVAFLPRLTPGGSVSIYNGSNFGSIVATYDQGSYVYRVPPFSQFFLPFFATSFYTSILILLAILSFAIAFRRKRKSKSKFVSDILTDVMRVQNELDDNNHKSDPNGTILHLHAWKSNIDKRQFVEDYRDYQKIDNFYSTMRSRKCYLLQKQVSSDELKRRNQDCINKAKITNTEIDWRKFHKLDLVLVIPAIILGTLLMDTAVTELSIIFTRLIPSPPPPYTWLDPPWYHFSNVYQIILLGISSFFIIRLILKSSQGVIVDIYGIPPIFRSHALLLYCFVIVGIIPSLVNLVLNHINCIDCRLTASFIVDIGSMFLLTWIVWRRYMKHKIKRRPSEIGETSTNQREFKRSPI